MSEESPLIFTGFMALVFAAFAVIAIIQRNDLKHEAIKRGYAEWKAETNGSASFQWKEARP